MVLESWKARDQEMGDTRIRSWRAACFHCPGTDQVHRPDGKVLPVKVASSPVAFGCLVVHFSRQRVGNSCWEMVGLDSAKTCMLFTIAKSCLSDDHKEQYIVYHFLHLHVLLEVVPFTYVSKYREFLPIHGILDNDNDSYNTIL